MMAFKIQEIIGRDMQICPKWHILRTEKHSSIKEHFWCFSKHIFCDLYMMGSMSLLIFHGCLQVVVSRLLKWVTNLYEIKVVKSFLRSNLI